MENRIKRLMREAVKDLNIDNKYVAFVYVGKELPTYSEVEISIKTIIDAI